MYDANMARACTACVLLDQKNIILSLKVTYLAIIKAIADVIRL
jgi:hypothetical protein